MSWKTAVERISPEKLLQSYEVSLHLLRYFLAEANILRGRTLDLGAGTGYGAPYIGRVATQLVAVDYLDSLDSRYKSCYTHVVRGDATRLPFVNNAFDNVVALEVIEHVPSYTRFLHEVRRVLCPRGRLVLSTPNRTSPSRRLFMMVGWRNPFHIREFSWTEIDAILDFGFEILGKRGLDFFKFAIEPMLGRSGFMSSLFLDTLARSFPSLSGTIFVVAKAR